MAYSYFYGFHSYNTVTIYLKHLEKKGYVRLPEKNRKRGMRIIRALESKSFEPPLLGRVEEEFGAVTVNVGWIGDLARAGD